MSIELLKSQVLSAHSKLNACKVRRQQRYDEADNEYRNFARPVEKTLRDIENAWLPLTIKLAERDGLAIYGTGSTGLGDPDEPWEVTLSDKGVVVTWMSHDYTDNRVATYTWEQLQAEKDKQQ